MSIAISLFMGRHHMVLRAKCILHACTRWKIPAEGMEMERGGGCWCVAKPKMVSSLFAKQFGNDMLWSENRLCVI